MVGIDKSTKVWWPPVYKIVSKNFFAWLWWIGFPRLVICYFDGAFVRRMERSRVQIHPDGIWLNLYGYLHGLQAELVATLEKQGHNLMKKHCSINLRYTCVEAIWFATTIFGKPIRMLKTNIVSIFTGNFLYRLGPSICLRQS